MGSKNEEASPLRAIPAVEKVLQALGPVSLPRAATVAVVRRELSAIRAAKERLSFDALLLRIRSALGQLAASRIQPVINGTGIIIHTNLGRAPLGKESIEALTTIGASYNNLEYDLPRGVRGSRALYLEHNLALLCGAEAATVVNNCAAALVLILRHFAAHKPEVIISRGELIQIGGGFRIPEILEASGAQLREVGTTNKTSIEDYAGAIGPLTGLILKVHRSNFFMDGFVDSPSLSSLAALARSKRVPLVEDLGSGAVACDRTIPLLDQEPAPQASLKAGAQLVCFSGDKLFGGPQAGIIAGKTRLVRALKREPFFRALRCDKLILAALEATTDRYLNSASERESPVPVLTMLRTPIEALRARAEAILSALGNSDVTARIGLGQAGLGGGTSPRAVIPSVTIDLVPQKIPVAEMAARLRAAVPPVIGYVAGGKFRLDLRTVFPEQDEDLIRALKTSCSRS